MRFRLKSSSHRRKVLGLMIGVCLVSYAAVATAQEAGITGQVRDESGGVLPGVVVVTTSETLQVGSMTDVTDAQGEYRLTPLPIGVYTVEYTLQGFQTFRQVTLRLETGVQLRLDIVMEVATLTETITVSGVSPVVDVTATAPSTQFTEATLQFTPTSRNGLISIGSQAPGVTSLTDVGGGTIGLPVEFASFGQKLGSTNTIEGVFTAISGGRGGGYGGNYFDFDSFAEVRVQSMGQGPELVHPGPAFTMVVKSGGNVFHGTGQLSYMNDALETSNIDAELTALGVRTGNPLDRRTDSGGDMGGRIIRDKLWFYGSGRYRYEKRGILGAFDSAGDPAKGVVGENLYNQKVSYQMSPSNRLVFFNFWGRKHVHGGNVDANRAWESRNRRFNIYRVNKLEWQATRGNSLVFSSQFGYWWWGNRTHICDREQTDELRAAMIPRGLRIFFDADQSDFADGRPSRSDIGTRQITGSPERGCGGSDIGKWDYKGTVSYYKPDLFFGSHEFKTGFNYEPGWGYGGGLPDRGDAGQYRLYFDNGVPLRIDVYNGPVQVEKGFSFITGYVNDSWTIARRLTLNLGARFERDDAWAPEQCRLPGVYTIFPAACIDQTEFGDFNSVAPRLFFSYDVLGDATTVLRGGWGRFYDQRTMGEQGYLNPISDTITTYTWRDLNGDLDYDENGPEVNLDPNGPDFLPSSPRRDRLNFTTPVQGLLNLDQTPMGTDQFTLTLERELAPDVGLRVSGFYIRTFDELRYTNTARPFEAYNVPVSETDPGPDGVVGNADDPGGTVGYFEYSPALTGIDNEQWIISNDPGNSERHRGIDVQLSKRLSNRWQILGSVTLTQNDVPLPRFDEGFFTAQRNNARGISLDNPNSFINTSRNFTDKAVKISALYIFPGDVAASWNLNYHSGLPQARQVLVRGGTTISDQLINVEPLGSISLDALSVMDLRLSKAIDLGAGKRLDVRVNFHNLMNANSVTRRNLQSGSRYLQVLSILPARIVEFGTTFSF